jgi:polysaccharide biosynthesis/export protein
MKREAVLIVGLLFMPSFAQGNVLSPADRVQITVTNGEEFSGEQIVRSDGTIQMPLLGSIQAAGLEESVVQQKITGALRKYIKDPQVNLRLSAAGAITVSVNGAVYSPGPVVLTTQALTLADKVSTASQDVSPARTLAAAIRTAGGLRPQASKMLTLTRNGTTRNIDVSGAFDNRGFENVALVSGDVIDVPSTDKIDETLLRPSQLTPATLTINVAGKLPNPGQLSLPIGARLVDGLAAAGAGGGGITEANREAVLVRRDLKSGQLIAKVFAVDALTDGPPLMQGDTVVVREGTTSNVMDFLKGFFSPLSPLLYLFR